MKTPNEIQKDALELIRQTDASYRQLSKVLCDKENATLEEVLQAASQVKCGYSIPARSGKSLALMQSQRIAELEAELEAVKRERDAAVRDIPRACGYCKWYEITNNGCTPDHDCKNSNGCLNISGINTGWEWRGVCPENTEVQDGHSDA